MFMLIRRHLNVSRRLILLFPKEIQQIFVTVLGFVNVFTRSRCCIAQAELALIHAQRSGRIVFWILVSCIMQFLARSCIRQVLFLALPGGRGSHDIWIKVQLLLDKVKWDLALLCIGRHTTFNRFKRAITSWANLFTRYLLDGLSGSIYFLVFPQDELGHFLVKWITLVLLLDSGQKFILFQRRLFKLRLLTGRHRGHASIHYRNLSLLSLHLIEFSRCRWCFHLCWLTTCRGSCRSALGCNPLQLRRHPMWLNNVQFTIALLLIRLHIRRSRVHVRRRVIGQELLLQHLWWTMLRRNFIRTFSTQWTQLGRQHSKVCSLFAIVKGSNFGIQCSWSSAKRCFMQATARSLLEPRQIIFASLLAWLVLGRTKLGYILLQVRIPTIFHARHASFHVSRRSEVGGRSARLESIFIIINLPLVAHAHP